MQTIGFGAHDHRHCVRDALSRAQAHCAAQGLKLTPVRQRVLEILLQGHRAMGAYDILDILRAEGHAAQPPVAYRALDFLTTHGFAHKIERLNAFVACVHSGEAHRPAFLICRGCNAVAEADAAPVRAALSRAAVQAGFTIEQATIEAVGLCPVCRAGAVDTSAEGATATDRRP